MYWFLSLSGWLTGSIRQTGGIQVHVFVVSNGILFFYLIVGGVCFNVAIFSTPDVYSFFFLVFFLWAIVEDLKLIQYCDVGRLFSCFVLFFLCKSDGSFHLIAGMSNCRLDVTALEISGSDFLQSLKGQLTPQWQMFTFDLHHVIIYIFFLFEVVFAIGAFFPATELYPPSVSLCRRRFVDFEQPGHDFHCV